MTRWLPIEDLPPEAAGWGDPEVGAMAAEWAEGSARLAHTPEVQQFRAELIREIAIETGIIEGLYRIDRGTTETLIRVGLIRSELEQGVLDRPASEILPMLEDHQSATEGLFDFVKQNRDLSTAYIKELHSHLTRHQPETEAITPEGQRIRVPLLRGEWKRLPNNPRRPDGSVHEYCPPEHVAAEMDRLIAMHRAHEAAGVPPDVAAAWLHHRFTQIHPFQDGNGRVARSLASLVFLRARWTLVNITRNDAGYIEALEKADDGDLQTFIGLLSKGQRDWFDRALSVLSAAESREGLSVASDRVRLREGVRATPDQAWRLLRSLQTILYRNLSLAVAELSLPEDIDWQVRRPGDEKELPQSAFERAYDQVRMAPKQWDRAPIRNAIFVEFKDAVNSRLGFAFDEDAASKTGEVVLMPFIATDALLGGKQTYFLGAMRRLRTYPDRKLEFSGDALREEVVSNAGRWLDEVIPFLLLEWERRR